MLNSLTTNQSLSFSAKACEFISLSRIATVQDVMKISKALGIDIATANKRLLNAQMTKGINVKNLKLMKMAIAGKFETAPQPAIKKSYVYKQKKYISDGGPCGNSYADSFMKSRSR